MSGRTIAAKKPSNIPAKSIALPVEHGAWGFLFEPLIAGVIIAPSIAAPFIPLLAIGAFLTRQPLKFFLGDWQQKRTLPRTRIARKFVLIFGGIALFGLLGTLIFAPLHSFLPFVLAAPLVIYLIVQDIARQTRHLMPELLAAAALASSISVLALAGGFASHFALALWAIILARLIPSILYVRNRVRMGKQKEFAIFAPIASHVAALLLVIGIYYIGLASLLTVVMAAFLACRAIYGLSPYRQKLSAKAIGVWEVIYGVIYALSIGVGYYAGI
ncbi:MAG: YwiC-like family protein [Acidobacteria bacterium]|nr:YwiC-like family protein [Acidobacteriota bacterium]